MHAAILLEDNFDSYVDQAAYVAQWPVVGAVVSGSLNGTQSVSAPNSVNFATTAQRNQHAFAESGEPTSLDLNNVVRFSFDFFDSNAAINPYRQHNNLQDGAAPSSSGQLIAIGLNNNQLSTANGGNFYMGRILGYTPTDTGGTSGSFFKLNDDPLLLRSTGWHNLAVEISDLDFKFFVDGTLAKTVPQTGLTLRSYDLVRIGSGLSSTAEVFIDNVKVETIPEPSSFALGFLGVAALLSRRRSRASR